MHKHHEFATVSVSDAVFDIYIIFAVYTLLAIMFHGGVFVLYLWMFVTFAVVYVLLMAFLGMYNVTRCWLVSETIKRVSLAAVFSSLCISAVVFLLKIAHISRLFFMAFAVSAFIILLIKRILMLKISSIRRKSIRSYAVFLGDPAIYDIYVNSLSKTSIECTFADSFLFFDERIDTPEKFGNYLAEKNLHEVVIAYNPCIDFHYSEYMELCEDMGLTVRVIPEIFEMPNSMKFVSQIGTLPVITYHSVSKNQIQLFVKRAIDIVGSLVGIILSSPIMLITAIAIKLESPGPVFFTQTRVGRYGKPFKIIKFRSMCDGAENLERELAAKTKVKDGVMFKIDNDPRVTKVGKTIRNLSIDELPQFFNILKGDMSLVGTRPPSMKEFKAHCLNQRRRLSIKPGLTGIWQVSGRSEITDFNEIVSMDMKYIDEWSIALDLKLIFKTVGVVLARKGAQ
jgi:exopolysaccharide biosynthesis polyprenyl glycosylphosphotransferase